MVSLRLINITSFESGCLLKCTVERIGIGLRLLPRGGLEPLPVSSVAFSKEVDFPGVFAHTTPIRSTVVK